MRGIEKFSSIMYVDECLLDEKRTQAFAKAIEKVVKDTDIVLDAGTGSGILALFAARAGAKKVLAVEVDKEAVLLAKKSFDANPEGSKIQLIFSDITKLKLNQPVDVLVMELLDTGLINEEQAVALNALRENGVIGSKTRLIPERVVCAVELVDYDFSLYGFKMPLIFQARNNGVDSRIKTFNSEKATYRQINFYQPIDLIVREKVRVLVTKEGIINALRLSTQTFLTSQMSLWETDDMNMPVVVPVEPLNVLKDQFITVHVQYKMAEGFDSFSVKLST